MLVWSSSGETEKDFSSWDLNPGRLQAPEELHTTMATHFALTTLGFT
ncbi:unnamed protein product [Rhodiola kirilowii]